MLRQPARLADGAAGLAAARGAVGRERLLGERAARGLHGVAWAPSSLLWHARCGVPPKLRARVWAHFVSRARRQYIPVTWLPQTYGTYCGRPARDRPRWGPPRARGSCGPCCSRLPGAQLHRRDAAARVPRCGGGSLLGPSGDRGGEYLTSDRRRLHELATYSPLVSLSLLYLLLLLLLLLLLMLLLLLLLLLLRDGNGPARHVWARHVRVARAAAAARPVARPALLLPSPPPPSLLPRPRAGAAPRAHRRTPSPAPGRPRGTPRSASRAGCTWAPCRCTPRAAR